MKTATCNTCNRQTTEQTAKEEEWFKTTLLHADGRIERIEWECNECIAASQQK